MTSLYHDMCTATSSFQSSETRLGMAILLDNRTCSAQHCGLAARVTCKMTSAEGSQETRFHKIPSQEGYLGSGPSLLAELSSAAGCPLPALAAAFAFALASARARIASAFFPPPPCSNACSTVPTDIRACPSCVLKYRGLRQATPAQTDLHVLTLIWHTGRIRRMPDMVDENTRVAMQQRTPGVCRVRDSGKGRTALHTVFQP